MIKDGKKYTGVSYYKRYDKYEAYFCIGTEKWFVGYYNTPEEAHIASKAGEAKYLLTGKR